MGYTPNNFGRGLRSGKSRLIGYFRTIWMHRFFADIFQGSGEKLAEREYGILSCWPAKCSTGNISHNLDMMLSKNVDGIIFVGGDWLSLGSDAFQMLNSRNIPFVFCSRIGNCIIELFRQHLYLYRKRPDMRQLSGKFLMPFTQIIAEQKVAAIIPLAD